MAKKVKLTVIRTEYYHDLADKYAIPDLGGCPWHHEGHVLISDGEHMPRGMCEVAWNYIFPFVQQLSRGELVQPTGTWLNDDKICVAACPDGIRPVIFHMEAMD